MDFLATVLTPNLWIGVTFVFHAAAMVMEIFFWRSMSNRLLGFGKDQADLTASIAANQGIYNSFIAAGLLLSFTPLVPDGQNLVLQVFLLGCAVVAGIFGTLTVHHPRRSPIRNYITFALQWVPPALALLGLWLTA